MVKKTLVQKVDALTSIVERSFAKQGREIKDLTESVTFVVKHMATKEETASKDQMIALHTQVNGIETDIRSMKHAKLEVRVADLEEKVFGRAREIR